MNTDLKARIRDQLDKQNLSMRRVSLDIGASETLLRDYFRNPEAGISAHHLTLIAKRLNTSVAQLTGEPPPEQAATSKRTLPVLGTAAGSFDGAQQLAQDPVEWWPHPAALAGVRGAYALRVVGESMMPLFKPDDPIFVHPHKQVRVGDIVVIQEERDGEVYAWIKELAGRTDTHVLTLQYNPPEEVKIALKHIVYVHRVLTTAELMGV